MRQSMKLGLPKLREQLSPDPLKNLKPLSRAESRRCYQQPNREFDAPGNHPASLPSPPRTRIERLGHFQLAGSVLAGAAAGFEAACGGRMRPSEEAGEVGVWRTLSGPMCPVRPSYPATSATIDQVLGDLPIGGAIKNKACSGRGFSGGELEWAAWRVATTTTTTRALSPATRIKERWAISIWPLPATRPAPAPPALRKRTAGPRPWPLGTPAAPARCVLHFRPESRERDSTQRKPPSTSGPARS